MGAVGQPVDAGAGLGTQLMAIGLASDVERLNGLDDAWTAYLSAEPEPATVEADLPVLGGLIEEMCSLLERVTQGSRELGGVVRELPINLDDELRNAVALHPLGESFLGMLPDAPFAEQVVQACSIVEQDAPAEINELKEKLRRLKEEGYSPGDIGRRMKCAIFLVGAGASLIGIVMTPVALVPGVAVAAVGSLTSSIAGANGWNCKRAGDLATA